MASADVHENAPLLNQQEASTGADNFDTQKAKQYSAAEDEKIG